MASLMYLEGEILFREYRKSIPKGWHCHHIIPKYRCKQLGIDPNFYDNLVGLSPEEHVQAHIERWNRLKHPDDWYAIKLLDDRIHLPPNPKQQTGEKNHMYGKKHTDESKKKISEAGKLRTQSPETRKKISETMTGEKNHNYGKKTSAETRKKISEAKKGVKKSAETKKNMSVGWMKRKARIKWA
jgi:hypothetical protein